MKFQAITLLALVAGAVAMPDIFGRQAADETQDAVNVEAPAMSDKNGNVVQFDTAKVNQPNKNAGI